ncbi:hypothetical protein [Chitinophaga sp. RAB17]|uniref:hypothetical protein n=1 Tax=Chitinophaga sp. RAB17 TaxID=3233049 RepID=UPI003F8DEBFE
MPETSRQQGVRLGLISLMYKRLASLNAIVQQRVYGGKEPGWGIPVAPVYGLFPTYCGNYMPA